MESSKRVIKGCGKKLADCFSAAIGRIGGSLDAFEEGVRSFFRKNRKGFCFSFVVLLTLVIATFLIWSALYVIGRYVPDSKPMLSSGLKVALTLLTLVFYFLVIRRIMTNDPIHRDRMLFSGNGMGMALYAFHFIVLVLALICTIAYIWSVEGIYVGKEPDQPRTRIAWEVFSQFADPGNIYNSKGRGGHIIALVSAMLGVLSLSGLAISSVVSILANLRDQWRRGLKRYKRGFKNYVVIVGINEQAPAIIRKSLRSGADFILIQTKQNVETERAKLELKLDREDEEKVVFYYGERTSGEDIEDLMLERAKEVFVLGEYMGNENEKDHDSFNMRCLELVSNYCGKLSKKKNWKGLKLKCHVDLEYQSTYTIFKSTHIYKQLNASLEFIPFNVHEIWAKKVLIDNYAIVPGNRSDAYKVQKYLPLDCYKDESGNIQGIRQETDKVVHLFVVGMNQMGVALAIQTALYLHLPNFHTKGLRTTISFIDDHAVEEGEYLKGRYPALFELCRNRNSICGKDRLNRSWSNQDDPLKRPDSRFRHLGDNFMDVQWEFIEGNVAADDIRNYMSEVASDIRKTCTIAVCFNNPQQSIATALYLPETVLKRVLQVFVYQQDNFDLIQKVATGESEWKRYEKLKPFGMLENCYKGDVLDNVMAKLALTLYKRKTLKNSNIDALINYCDRMWHQEGIVNKWANINLVDSFASKLRSVGLERFSTKEEVSSVLGRAGKNVKEFMVRAEHSRWLTEKLTMGYRPLSLNEMNEIANTQEEKEKKALKERFKTKSRAHLDICSYDMLEKVDPDVLGNDKYVIDNVLKLKFFKLESEVICRQAFRYKEELGYGSEQVVFLSELLKEMVTIKNGSRVVFWMGETLVTRRLWERVMGKSNNATQALGEDFPVTNVSKNDIEAFHVVLNDMTGLHFRLPEKDEWLYAAQSGLHDGKSGEKIVVEDMAWFNDNDIHAVHKKKPMSNGLFDVLGNVWEWTQTHHGNSTYYYCGGSFRFGKDECDVFNEKELWASYWIPDFKSDDLGFRLLLPFKFEKNLSPLQDEKEEKEKMFIQIVKHLKMVESGSFVMGSEEEADRPPVRVSLSSFKIADAPITQRQWMAFMDDNNPSIHKGDELPVEMVSYKEALAFIERLNDFHKTHANIIGEDNVVFDLPTEAQWEYSARGGNKSQGYFYAGSDDPDVVAWHYGVTKGTHPVRTKNPNELGLYDMCGNVWEWCKDYYQPSCYVKLSGLKDPLGPQTGHTRVFKGGSWRFTADECRLSRASYWTEDYASDDLGFRVVLNYSVA